MRILNCLTAFVLLFYSFYLTANESSSQNVAPQFPEVVIGGTQERLLQSEIVDQEYKLWISLPRGYKESDQSYPVIYLLDAQWDFTLMISLYGQLNYDGDIPDAILVGITWGGDNPNAEELRVRDFTPTAIEQSKNSGGANNFLSFIKEELVSFMSKEYRTNDERYLMGSSLGGLFTFYAMFDDPSFFTGFLPTAPSLWWDDEVTFKMAEKSLAHFKDNPTRLYSAAGEFDGVLPGFKKMQSFLETKKIPGLTYKTQLFENMGHSGIKANGNVRGLQFLFEKQAITLPEQKLQSLAGAYFEQKHDIRMSMIVEKNQLVGVFEDGSKQPFLALSENEFFQRGANLTLKFNTEKTPIGFVAKPFDGVYNFVRVESEN